MCDGVNFQDKMVRELMMSPIISCFKQNDVAASKLTNLVTSISIKVKPDVEQPIVFIDKPS